MGEGWKIGGEGKEEGGWVKAGVGCEEGEEKMGWEGGKAHMEAKVREWRG